MIIGFDFDRVLFDTDSFNEYLKENVEGLHHVDEEPYDEHGCYSPEKHAELCGIDPRNIYDALKDLKQFLYSDINNLKEFEGQHKVVIVTRGEKKFQRAKIDGSGASNFVDEVKVVEEGSKQVGIDFLVDDWEEELERVNVPGFLFDRSKHTIDDVVEKVEQYDES